MYGGFIFQFTGGGNHPLGKLCEKKSLGRTRLANSLLFFVVIHTPLILGHLESPSGSLLSLPNTPTKHTWTFGIPIGGNGNTYRTWTFGVPIGVFIRPSPIHRQYIPHLDIWGPYISGPLFVSPQYTSNTYHTWTFGVPIGVAIRPSQYTGSTYRIWTFGVPIGAFICLSLIHR